MRERTVHLEESARCADTIGSLGPGLQVTCNRRTSGRYVESLRRPLIVTWPGTTTQSPCGNKSK